MEISKQIVRQRAIGGRIAGPGVAGAMGLAGRPLSGIACVTSAGILHLLDAELNHIPGYPIDLGGTAAASPALADLDGDGSRDLVVAAGAHLHALNWAGARLDGFPVPLSGKGSTSPAVGDLDGDGRPDVVSVLDDGSVAGFDPRGRMLDGFPLSAGSGEGWPVIAVSGDSILLFVASSTEGAISGWRTGRVNGPAAAAQSPWIQFPWTQFQGDAARSGREMAVLPQGSLRNDFFPAERAYNWPNPVYGGSTALRYYVREDASVRISIFDLAGDLVAEFTGPGVGGLDNEIAWDVSAVVSGIYFARIEASGAGGSGTALVKVAVVK